MDAHRTAIEDAGPAVARYRRTTDRHRWRHAWIDDLEHALVAGDLELRYQPVVDLLTRRVTGVEALLRWRHPRLGLLAPASFIGAVEGSPLLAPVTRTVLDQALAACARWRRVGLELEVAINVAAPSLHDTRLVEDITVALARHRVPAGALIVEVTERMPLMDLDRGCDVLGRLAALGVTVSLDDFGTGHSGLQHLHRLPVHVVKLDRTFVASMCTDATASAIVRGTIDLAHELGVRVVGEGVEDAAAVDALGRAGCDEAQGHGLVPPVAEADVRAAIRLVEADLARPGTPAA